MITVMYSASVDINDVVHLGHHALKYGADVRQKTGLSWTATDGAIVSGGFNSSGLEVHNRGDFVIGMGTEADFTNFDIMPSTKLPAVGWSKRLKLDNLASMYDGLDVNLPELQAMRDRGDVHALHYKLEHITSGGVVTGFVLRIAMLVEPDVGFKISKFSNPKTWPTYAGTSIVWTQAVGGALQFNDPIWDAGHLTFEDLDGTESDVGAGLYGQSHMTVVPHPVTNGNLIAYTEGLVAVKNLLGGL